MANEVQQISVFLENKRGTLCNLLELLATNDINLLALNVADSADFGIVRIIVNSASIPATEAALHNAGLIARVSPVLCAKVPHAPGGMAHILRVLDNAGVGVEYAYSFCRSTLSDATILLRPTDHDAAAQALAGAGIETIGQAEVDAF